MGSTRINFIPCFDAARLCLDCIFELDEKEELSWNDS